MLPSLEMPAQSAARGSSSHRRVRLLGIGALLAWAALALQLGGVMSFDALHPGLLAGCATRPPPGSSTMPPGSPGAFAGVTERVTLRRNQQKVVLERGDHVTSYGAAYTLVGLDRQARVLMLEHPRLGLYTLSLSGHTLTVKKMRTGARITTIVASNVLGVVGGALAGTAIGASVSSGSTSGGTMAGGCLLGMATGAALATGTSVVATREDQYRLGPTEWRVDEAAW